MKKILLITPPFLQVNSPYPATAYLKSYLQKKDIQAVQCDLSIDLIGSIFSRQTLTEIFELWEAVAPELKDANLERIYALRRTYSDTIDTVISFLRSGDQSLADMICMPDFLPQASRFESCADLEQNFGDLGTIDCAKYLCTLYLQDISDYIRATVSPHFEIVRYAESISVAAAEFSSLQKELDQPLNIIECKMTALLEAYIKQHEPQFIGFTVPFPGNLLMVLRACEFIKANYPEIKVIIGGGYPTTELRSMSDRNIFKYVDYIILDDGELALERIINGGDLLRTYTKENFFEAHEKISHRERDCPDFEGLPFDKYMSLCEVTNPMHRMWSDGRWNKMIMAHGCYWAKCAFCDTTLDYIKCYDTVDAKTFVDWMEQVAQQTGSRGFHFVDEAAPPKMIKEVCLEIIRRGLRFSWWTNIRFETAYTGDLCKLMATAGCVAVAGGLEVANDRLLEKINKGVSIEQATIAMRNFYYCGIMVHTYLMYGFPTQTLAETIDSLEVVRQMFRAELIGSAFWHRYAMTLHSPSGQDPEQYGVRRKNMHVNNFANNEVYFAEDRGYNINMVGEALRTSLAYYLSGEGLEKAAHKWFQGKVQPSTVEAFEITDHLIKPDKCRIYDPKARLVWLGGDVHRSEEGIIVYSNSETKEFKFKDEDANFLIEITRLVADLDKITTFEQVALKYAEFSSESFAVLYHSKKWDKLRSYGLLQL